MLPGDVALIIEPGRATLPSLLKSVGYTTAVAGKWHLGPWTQITVPEPGFLFDLAADPGETRDRAAAHLDKVTELRALLAHTRDSGRTP